MNINDRSVLEMLNKLIVINRLNKSQILQMVNLVSISNDINDLKDNLKWESSKSFNQNTWTHYLIIINSWNLHKRYLIVNSIN